MQITKNFTLNEFAVSRKHPHLAKKVCFTVSDVEKIQYLCEKFLQPIRDVFGLVSITSGKRSRQLNSAVGGSKNSDHLFLMDSAAVDFTVSNETHSLVDVVEFILKLPTPFKQCIYYPSDQFIHLSKTDHTNRENELLMYQNGRYIPWKLKIY